MKTELFFQDIKSRNNVVIMDNIDNQVKEKI